MDENEDISGPLDADGKIVESESGEPCPQCGRISYSGGACLGCGKRLAKLSTRSTGKDKPSYEKALAKAAAPEPERTTEELIEDALLDAGVPFDVAERAIIEIKTHVERMARTRNAAFIEWLFNRLDRVPFGCALRRHLLPATCKRTFEEDARALKVTKQNLSKHQQTIRELFPEIGPGLTKQTLFIEGITSPKNV